MANTALMVIDVQYGMFIRKEYDGVAVHNEGAFLENLKMLIEKARAASVPVIYVQHIFKDIPFMAKGQPMWEVHPDIRPEPKDIVIEKEHADAFFDTPLDETLKKLGITELVITGMQTEYCVDTTCRRALSLGYKNVLVSDGHSTFASETISAEQIIAHHNEVLSSQFVSLQAAQDVVF